MKELVFVLMEQVHREVVYMLSVIGHIPHISFSTQHLNTVSS